MKKLCSLLLALAMLFSVGAGMEMSTSAANVTGAQIVAEARKHVGKSYVANAAGPDSFDCSGLTMYVFAKFGISLPHSTYDIYNNPTAYGTVIQSDAYDKAVPGDLICWYGHIGIYTGIYNYSGTQRGFIVDAANSSKGVVEQPIWPANGSYKVVRVYGVSDIPEKQGNMTVPKITLGSSEYGVGNTVAVSWEATSSNTDFMYYKITITNNTTGDICYSVTTSERHPENNTLNYKLTLPGDYTIAVYSIPYNEATTRQRSASKSFSVGKKVSSIDDLYKTVLVPADDPDDPFANDEYVEIFDLYGWAYDSDGNIYFGINDTLAKGWLRYSYVWYYFGDDGKMQTGWLKDKDVWYYLSNGPMVKGWAYVSNKWYYMNSSGAMQTGWQYIDNYWYYLNVSGAMQTSWKKLGNYWYYFAPSGKMATRWRKVNNEWYFMLDSGRMCTGWRLIDDKWYFFETSGKMRYDSLYYKGKTYYFNSSGACTNP